jgi:molybdate transport system regulatory protein
MGKRWGLRSKLWLECEGQPFMGDGRLAMLRSIQRNGSIKLAAQETGISYRRMRGAIQEMERAIGFTLVRIIRGGRGGGGAELTKAAHSLMAGFEKLSAGFQGQADARFHELQAFFEPPNGTICHSVGTGEDAA